MFILCSTFVITPDVVGSTAFPSFPYKVCRRNRPNEIWSSTPTSLMTSRQSGPEEKAAAPSNQNIR